MSDVHYLSVEDIVFIYENVVRQKYFFDQKDIPPLASYPQEELSRIVSEIQAIVENPAKTFDGVDLYQSIEEKGAILFLLLTKKHIFFNGNKRTAVYALFLFMFINNKWLTFKHLELYQLSESMAKRDGQELAFDNAKMLVVKAIKDRIQPIDMHGLTAMLSENSRVRAFFDIFLGRNE